MHATSLPVHDVSVRPDKYLGKAEVYYRILYTMAVFVIGFVERLFLILAIGAMMITWF